MTQAQQLAQVEQEYSALTTKVVYARFDGNVQAEDEMRLKQLGQQLIELSAPKRG